MPLITVVFLAYASGLWLAIGGRLVVGLVVATLLAIAGCARRRPEGWLAALTMGLALATGRETARIDAGCRAAMLRGGVVEVRLLEPLRTGKSAGARALEPCGVRVRVTARAAAAAGSVLRVEGSVRRAGGTLAIRGRSVTVLEPPGLIARSRARVGTRIDQLFGADGALVRALVLAEQYDLDVELRTRWADAGIIHMVSVSGLHVSIIAGALVGAFGAFGWPRMRAEAAALAVLLAYVAWIGWPPPAVRSAVMTAWTLMARWQQRPPAVWAVWGVGSGISLVDPHVVTDLGWQLSVVGMAGLVASGRLVESLRLRRPMVRYLVEGAVATGIATIVSAPIVAWTFGRISIAAVVSNLAAAPLFNIAQPLLFLAVVLSWVPEAVIGLVVDAARGALALINVVARLGALVPFATVSVSPDAFTATCLVIVATGLVLAGAMREVRWGITILLVGVVGATWARVIPRGNGRVEMHVIDVGQGDALAIRTPRGRWILVDAGPSWDGGDAGRRTVAPYIRRFGGDVVHQVITHPHLDHYGGVPGVLSPLAVDSVWEGGAHANRGYVDWRSRERRPWGVLSAGDSLRLDGVVVRVLAPSRPWRESQENPNEASVVLRVEFGAQRWLLTGDAEAGAEQWLLSHGRDALGATVLKVGHHGSRSSSSPGFLEAVTPRVAVISVGRDNDYGHPSVEVLQRLDALGTHVLRTDDEGTIVLSSDGHSLEVRTEWGYWRYRGP
ncbi:MAG: DNA internalization-related competence protein ComEC/Rec2 [Gemmatimonadetes bacterium]|nr:DNA internalization-related competence protein ComEC/Rec2 [Gemmatimonadota bacterium]